MPSHDVQRRPRLNKTRPDKNFPLSAHVTHTGPPRISKQILIHAHSRKKYLPRRRRQVRYLKNSDASLCILILLFHLFVRHTSRYYLLINPAANDNAKKGMICYQ